MDVSLTPPPGDRMLIRMLELRPSCENCDRDLPPASAEARICSFECTFCSTCVDGVLSNVCPNCGGGFVARPVRPATPSGASALDRFPASATRIHKPVDPAEHAERIAALGNIPPEER